jgi:hypothetical protein
LGSQSHFLQKIKDPKQAFRLKLTAREGSKAKFKADQKQTKSKVGADESTKKVGRSRKKRKRAEASRREVEKSKERAERS